jgi:type II secretory pathway pseudopilin PulG
MDHSPPRSGDAGFALLEAIVSAAVLAVVSLAVLSGLDGATNSALRERARSVAAGLAEQDQERMRAMAAEQLGEYAPSSKTINVDGMDYTVQSSTRWVSDATGGTVSCTNNSSSVDYLQVSTVVTSTIVGKKVKPVAVSSLVAPPVSRAKGTVAVQVTDRLNQPIPLFAVTATAASGGTFTETTNELGCAIFLNVPVDSYTIHLSQALYVDAFGNTPGAKGVDVSNGTTQLITMRWDKAGASNWSVFTKDPFDMTKTRTSAAPRTLSGATVVNGSVSATHGDEPTLQRAFTASPATNLFPFLAPYTFFSGGCEQSNPSNYEPDYFDINPGAVTVGAGQVSPPATVQMYQPPLKLVLRDSAGGTGTGANGMIVYATLVKPTPESECSQTYKLTSIARTTAPAVVTNGVVSREGTNDSTYDPGLPFGTYDICARYISGSTTSTKRWWIQKGVNMTTVTGADLGTQTVNTYTAATLPAADAPLCPA